MDNQLLFPFEHQEILTKIEIAKQNGDYLQAISLAEAFYQEYPSLANHYRLVEIYLAQQDEKTAWELLKSEQEAYCQSPVFCHQFVEIALKQHAFLLVREIAYQEFLTKEEQLSILGLLKTAEQYYQIFFQSQLQEKKQNWYACLMGDTPIFTEQWQSLCHQLTSQTLLEIMQSYLPKASNQWMIARCMELLHRLHFELLLTIPSCFGGQETIDTKALALPNDQPYWRQVLNYLATALAHNHIDYYELLIQEIQVQMALSYPFTPPLLPEKYAQCLMHVYGISDYSLDNDDCSEKEKQIFQQIQMTFAQFQF